jgi:hypothetical protein
MCSSDVCLVYCCFMPFSLASGLRDKYLPFSTSLFDFAPTFPGQLFFSPSPLYFCRPINWSSSLISLPVSFTGISNYILCELTSRRCFALCHVLFLFGVLLGFLSVVLWYWIVLKDMFTECHHSLLILFFILFFGIGEIRLSSWVVPIFLLEYCIITLRICCLLF